MKHRSIPVLFVTILALAAISLAGCTKAAAPKIQPRMYTTLEKHNHPKEGLGAYGYLLFTHRPNSAAEKARYERCLLDFYLTFNDLGSYPSSIQPANIFVTYLFVIDDYMPNEKYLRSDNIDYAAAEMVLSIFYAQNLAGPVLIAFSTPFQAYRQRDQVLILDLSRFPDEDLQRGFLAWKRLITDEPSTWNNRFNFLRIRELLRNVIDTYGDSILAFIEKAA